MSPKRVRLGFLVGAVVGLLASQACGPTLYEEAGDSVGVAWQAADAKEVKDGGGGPQVCQMPPTAIGGNSCIFEAAGSPPGPIPAGAVFIPGITSCQELVNHCRGLLDAGTRCMPVLGGHGSGGGTGIRSTDDAGNTINRVWGCRVESDGSITRFCPEADACLGALAGGACTLSIGSCTSNPASCSTCTQVLANATGCSVQAANGSCYAGSNCYAVAPGWCTANPQPDAGAPDAGTPAPDAGPPPPPPPPPPPFDAGEIVKDPEPVGDPTVE